MSFPNLILSGDESPNARTITGIAVNFSGAGTDVGVYLKRLKHDVRRVYTKGNVNAATGTYKTTVAYDRFTLVHTFVGYVDVLSESVSRTASSTPQQVLNCDLIETAVLFATSNILFDVKHFDIGSIGADNPSNGDSFYIGKATAPSWDYKEDGATITQVAVWLIKDINVMDNGNNTSRVTFTFEAVEPQGDLAALLDPYAI